MKILYFAWLREKVGHAEENVELPADVATVAELLAWLETRGETYRAALSERGVVRVAVNQDYVEPDHALANEDEVALFPPVTGG